jgi:hypothetical protein
MVLERFERRWRARQVAAAKEQHAQLPEVPVVIGEERHLPHPADAVWSLLTGPDDQLGGPSRVQTFRMPGTPADVVGEVQCVVVRRPDGAWLGSIGEVVEREEGVRLVQRSWTTTHTHVETLTVAPDGDDRCTLRWDIETIAHPGTAVAARDELVASLRTLLARIEGQLAGRPVVEVPSPSTGCSGTGPIVEVEVVLSRSVPATAEAVWALIGGAAGITLLEPSWSGFTVPGSRSDEVGELVCLVPAVRVQGSVARFWQVVGLLPGRSRVVRGLSLAPQHAAELELSVVPEAGGARATFRAASPVHQDQARAERRRLTRAGEQYLERLRAQLETVGPPSG